MTVSRTTSQTSFAIRAAVYAALLLGILTLCLPLLSALLRGAVKAAHSASGWPAPDLLLDIQPLFVVPLCLVVFLALTAASDWISLGQRLLASALGTLSIGVVLTLHAIIAYSPYIPRSVGTWMVIANVLLFVGITLQFILWIVLVGLPHEWLHASDDQQDRHMLTQDRRSRVLGRGLSAIALTTGASALTLLAVCLVARDKTYDLRRQLAESIATDKQGEAFAGVMRLLQQDPDDLNLTYLGARIALRLGNRTAFQIMLYRACDRTGMVAYYFEQFEKPPQLSSAGEVSN